MAKSEVKLEKMKFEELMELLENTVRELEDGNVELDDSINKYTEAMKIVKACNERLENATKAVNKVLSENGELEDFKLEEE